MQESHFRVATIGVFSWATLQPEEHRFDFIWLDRVIDRLERGDRYFCLATPTAAQPAWMSQSYPDVLRVDNNGQRRRHGRRVNYCPCSPVYRSAIQIVAEKLAERYGRHPHLVLWHVSNEYGGQCYCERCAQEFRLWLQAHYTSLDELNQRWWTRFWSHTYTNWSQIEPPYTNGETLTDGLVVDYKRFQNAAMLECFKLERDTIRAIAPGTPITTNLMGAYPLLDYRAWAREMDVVSWDCYPWPSAHPADIAFLHDLNRSLRDGQPFVLMEQTPSSQNWQPVNALKRPGVLRLWSYLAVAHGADTVMYFQWRRGRGGCEKFHGAVIEHHGRSDVRVFQEVSTLGNELEQLGTRVLGGTLQARVAILFDWDNWWAIDSAVGPIQQKDYVGFVRKHYRALWERHVPVDVVFADSDLSGYDVVIAPMLHMVKDGVAERVKAQLEQGGSFVTTVFSGVVDSNGLALEGYPGPLRSLMGLWVEEIDALYENQQNEVVFTSGERFACRRLCEIIRLEGAEALAIYGRDFYAGTPAVTRHRIGTGDAYYIASDMAVEGLSWFYQGLLDRHRIAPVLELPELIEAQIRTSAEGKTLFVLNHRAEAVTVPLPERKVYRDLLRGNEEVQQVVLGPYDVAILAEG